MSQYLGDHTSCINHPKIQATTLCDRCARLICDDCRQTVIALELDFCSEHCISTHLALTGKRLEHGNISDISVRENTLVSNEDLVNGLRHPFVTGWKLWLHSLSDIIKRVALPFAGLALFGHLLLQDHNWGSNEAADITIWATGVIISVYAFFVINILISYLHIGHPIVDIYKVAIVRFLPTVATWVLSIMAAFVGILLFVIPGIIIGVRLFWADEFALVNRQNPFAAIKSSFELTRGFGGRIWVFQFLQGLIIYLVMLVAFVLLLLLAQLINLIAADLYSALMWVALSLLITLGYSFLHATEIAYFYGLRAEKSRSGSKGNKFT